MSLSKETARRSKRSTRAARASEVSRRDEGDLRHHKAPTSAAIPASADADSDPLAELRLLDTDELRERAASVVVPGAATMSRKDLLEALATYARSVVKEREERPISP